MQISKSPIISGYAELSQKSGKSYIHRETTHQLQYAETRSLASKSLFAERPHARTTPIQKVWSLAPGIQLGFAMHALLPHKQTYKKTLRKNYAYVLLLKHPQENCH